MRHLCTHSLGLLQQHLEDRLEDRLMLQAVVLDVALQVARLLHHRWDLAHRQDRRQTVTDSYRVIVSNAL